MDAEHLNPGFSDTNRWSNSRLEPSAFDAVEPLVNDCVLMISVNSLWYFRNMLYALYRTLDELVPGHPAFRLDAIVDTSSRKEQMVLGPATQVGTVVVNSYTKDLPFTSEFRYTAFVLAHGSASESSIQVRFASNV